MLQLFASMGLEAYRQKRNFTRTPEPNGKRSGKRKPRRAEQLQFVVQKHDARRLHYDFRLQIGDVLKSWAVPKGPSLDPGERRLAVQTEDHPLDYADFEGVIPENEYGAGPVLVWDRGYWFPNGDPDKAVSDGKLEFRLAGEKLRGGWRLVRMARRPGEKKDSWLLMKRRDGEAGSDPEELVRDRPLSVVSGRAIEEVEADRDRIWHSNRSQEKTKSKTLEPLERPEDIEGARKAPMPRSIQPQLATLVDEAPPGESWLHEIKHDGYRLLCWLDNGRARLVTRKGNDWSSHYPAVAKAIQALGDHRLILDGEVVALDPSGRSNFQALQNVGKSKHALFFYAFDLLYLDGYDLTKAPLLARKEALRLVLAPSPPGGTLRYSDHVIGRGEVFLREACARGLEGIVSKKADAPYRSRRSRSWLKIKCAERQEFVIVGYTDPSGARVGFGALLLATRDGGELRYAGKVGTGFGGATLRDLHQRLRALSAVEPPLTLPKRMRNVHWVEPKLVAEVRFGEWTDEGIIRHPVFLGLREDKSAGEVVAERPASKAPTEVAGVRLSHPDKLLYPEIGLTKRMLAEYYEAIADVVVPELRMRPLTLVRCPDGHHKHCFYQKHADTAPSLVPRVRVGKGEEYLMVDDLPAIVALVQLGVLEFHVWGSRADRLDRPDRLILDLDPGPGVKWPHVVVTGVALRDRLAELGLDAFARVTGGKGLHVVVPIERYSSWEDAKAFTQELANELVRHAPKHFTANMSKRRREGKIFIDYLRNARDSTAIASYSVRARPGAPVATPIHWDELDEKSDAPPVFSIEEVKARVAKGIDPWPGFETAARRLSAGMKRAVGMR